MHALRTLLERNAQNRKNNHRLLMLELTKDPYSQDTYGYYDQHGNRYVFLCEMEARTFLFLKRLEFMKQLAKA